MKRRIAACAAAMLIGAIAAGAQEHDHAKMLAEMAAAERGWSLSQDGGLFLMANRQGGARGGNDLVVPSWWMVMATHKSARGTLSLDAIAKTFRYLDQDELDAQSKARKKKKKEAKA